MLPYTINKAGLTAAEIAEYVDKVVKLCGVSEEDIPLVREWIEKGLIPIDEIKSAEHAARLREEKKGKLINGHPYVHVYDLLDSLNNRVCTMRLCAAIDKRKRES